MRDSDHLLSAITSRLRLIWHSAILLALPAGLEQLAHLESREGVSFRVEDDVLQWKEIVVGEEEVEVLEGFSLREKRDKSAKSPHNVGGCVNALTIQKLSMLSLIGGGVCVTSLTLENPSPSSTAVHLMKF